MEIDEIYEEARNRFPETLAKLSGIDVEDDPNIYVPKKGDKVVITEFTGIHPNDAARIARLDYVVVEDVDKHPIGEDGEYHWEYAIYIENFPWIFSPDQYKKYER